MLISDTKHMKVHNTLVKGKLELESCNSIFEWCVTIIIRSKEKNIKNNYRYYNLLKSQYEKR